MEKKDFQFRIELARIQNGTGILNGAAISMLGAAVGTAIATITLDGITNFDKHPNEFVSLFFAISVLLGIGWYVLRWSSRFFQKGINGLEERYAGKTDAEGSGAPAA